MLHKYPKGILLSISFFYLITITKVMKPITLTMQDIEHKPVKRTHFPQGQKQGQKFQFPNHPMIDANQLYTS